jgi:hypothetical protein
VVEISQLCPRKYVAAVYDNNNWCIIAHDDEECDFL